MTRFAQTPQEKWHYTSILHMPDVVRSFQWFFVFVNLFLHFQLNIVISFSKHTSLPGTSEKSIILSDSLTLDKFLCPIMLSPVCRLYLQKLVLCTTNLSCYASADFMVHKHLCCLHLSCLLSLLYYM